MTPTPDYTTHLVGWRVFHIKHRHLMSGYSSGRDGAAWWPYKPKQSFCDGNDFPPTRECSCGIYSYKTLNQALTHGQCDVIAKIAIWGVIVEHDGGWRSQFAYPLELWRKSFRMELVDYGVPTHEGVPSMVRETPVNAKPSTPIMPAPAVFASTVAARLAAHRRRQLDRAKERRKEQSEMIRLAREAGLIDDKGNLKPPPNTGG